MQGMGSYAILSRVVQTLLFEKLTKGKQRELVRNKVGEGGKETEGKRLCR